MGDQTPDARVRTYADVMKDQQLAREKDNTLAVRAHALLGLVPSTQLQCLNAG